MPSRKMAVLIYLVGFFLFLGLGAELSPDKTGEPIKPQEQTPQNSTQDQTTQSNSIPDKTTEEPKQQKTESLCKSDYATTLEAFTDLGDYYADNNSLEIISETPLHIRLSNLAVQGDHPDVKELMVKRAVIYGIYRSFIHTNKDEVTVTSYLIDMNNKKKLPSSPEYSMKITKKQALDIIKKYLPVQDYSDLIAKDGYGCSFSEDFNRVRFNDQNENEFNAFFSDLSSANK